MKKDRSLARRALSRVVQGLKAPSLAIGTSSALAASTGIALGSPALETTAYAAGAVALAFHGLGRTFEYFVPMKPLKDRWSRAFLGSHGDHPLRSTASVGGGTVGLSATMYGLTKLAENIPGIGPDAENVSNAIGELSNGVSYTNAAYAVAAFATFQNARYHGREKRENAPGKHRKRSQ